MRTKKTVENLNTRRLELMAKGYLNKNEIGEFVPCGYKTASDIYNSIRADVKTEGLENLSKVVLAKRVVKYLGLTTNEIQKLAKLEQEGII